MVHPNIFTPFPSPALSWPPTSHLYSKVTLKLSITKPQNVFSSHAFHEENKSCRSYPQVVMPQTIARATNMRACTTPVLLGCITFRRNANKVQNFRGGGGKSNKSKILNISPFANFILKKVPLLPQDETNDFSSTGDILCGGSHDCNQNEEICQ